MAAAVGRLTGKPGVCLVTSGETAEDLKQKITVISENESQIVSISATDKDYSKAADIANTVKKVNELNTLKNDMNNLLTSTNIAEEFLDQELKLKLFTPEAANMFDLKNEDLSRPARH